jgi:mannose-6-phosphate isomerase-like protein (cupin superfamily)
MSDKVLRDWGYYRVLHEVGEHVKLKELTVEPGKSLSMQKHDSRFELWFVAEGIATLYSLDSEQEFFHVGDYGLHRDIRINVDEWHQLRNEQTFPLKIIEIQYGDKCIEEDITRKV